MRFVPERLTRAYHRGSLHAKANSPHIFFGLGLAGMVTSTVLACRATLKLSETLGQIEDDFEVIKELKHHDDTSKYPEKEIQRDALYVYIKTGAKLGRLYGPSIIVGVVSITFLTKSHVQLHKRNLALMAAYSALQKTHEDYRARVREKLGEEEESDLYHGVVGTEITKDADGKKTVEKFVDPTQISQYAKFFDEGSVHWNDRSEFNKLFLQCQQNFANALLKSRGHLFLNEVYDMLDVGRTQAGSVVGWVMFNGGDDYVDFHLFRIRNANFVNGFEKSILLDFNVDGVIWDKIKDK